MQPRETLLKKKVFSAFKKVMLTSRLLGRPGHLIQTASLKPMGTFPSSLDKGEIVFNSAVNTFDSKYCFNRNRNDFFVLALTVGNWAGWLRNSSRRITVDKAR